MSPAVDALNSPASDTVWVDADVKVPTTWYVSFVTVVVTRDLVPFTRASALGVTKAVCVAAAVVVPVPHPMYVGAVNWVPSSADVSNARPVFV